MSINVQGCGYFGMSHLFLDVFRILILIDQKACKGVSEIVTSDFLDSCLFQCRYKMAIDQIVVINGSSRLIRKYQIKAIRRTGKFPLGVLGKRMEGEIFGVGFEKC